MVLDGSHPAILPCTALRCCFPTFPPEIATGWIWEARTRWRTPAAAAVRAPWHDQALGAKADDGERVITAVPSFVAQRYARRYSS
jgi:hypothetical protein